MPTLFDGKSFAAFLFDMDGTLLTSIVAAERVWAQWARKHGLDVAAFLPTIHGVRSVDTVRRLQLPGVDPVAEADAITQAEILDTHGVAPIRGAIPFVRSLPGNRWAIVTSAPRALARARLAAAGLPVPEVMIAADDVANGKPDPEGYRLAADRLGFSVRECLIFEDTAAGVEAAGRASAPVMVITETHRHPLELAHDQLRDYESLEAVGNASGRLTLVRKS